MVFRGNVLQLTSEYYRKRPFNYQLQVYHAIYPQSVADYISFCCQETEDKSPCLGQGNYILSLSMNEFIGCYKKHAKAC